MAYSDFTLAELLRRFGLTLETHQDLFGSVPPVAVDPVLQTVINRHLSIALATTTEKSRAELLIAPVLVEVWRLTGHRVSYYSGAPFNVDAANNLTGDADFLFTRGPQIPEVSVPILVVVEAKRENIASAYGQCGAEMVAALRMNQQANTGVDTVYGCITIGDNWKFLRLRGSELAIDLPEYLINQLDRILGILLWMVGHNPPAAAAA
jgi:hypothetical protein